MDGETIKDFTPEVKNNISDISSTSWTAVHNGMRNVISVAQAQVFSKLNASGVEVSGKTGTAQQSETHPDHALFVGFAQSSNPEVAFAIRIANGYSSTYAAEIGNDVMEYYYQVTRRKSCSPEPRQRLPQARREIKRKTNRKDDRM